jgi:hypothetical protein
MSILLLVMNLSCVYLSITNYMKTSNPIHLLFTGFSSFLVVSYLYRVFIGEEK